MSPRAARYRRRMATHASLVDLGVRERLTGRYGVAVDGWLADLPEVLSAVAKRWGIVLDSTIPLGNMSLVIRGRLLDGNPAVLKVCPDHTRIAHEAAALRRWNTIHSPGVLALDETLGALLIEAIEPGTPLVLSSAYPPLAQVCELLAALHKGAADSSYPSFTERVTYLFDVSAVMYERSPHLTTLIAPEMYARGRELALRLAANASPVVLLHGDLTPRNSCSTAVRSADSSQWTRHPASATPHSTQLTFFSGWQTTSRRLRHAQRHLPRPQAQTRTVWLRGAKRSQACARWRWLSRRQRIRFAFRRSPRLPLRRSTDRLRQRSGIHPERVSLAGSASCSRACPATNARWAVDPSTNVRQRALRRTQRHANTTP